MSNETSSVRAKHRSSDVGVMLALTLGTVIGPAILIDLVALAQAAFS